MFVNKSFAAGKTWDGGGGDYAWGTPANWSDDVVPTSSDDVTINGGIVRIDDIAGNVAGSLTLNGGTIYAYGPITISGDYYQTGGAVDNSFTYKAFNVGGSFNQTDGRFGYSNGPMILTLSGIGKTITHSPIFFAHLTMNGTYTAGSAINVNDLTVNLNKSLTLNAYDLVVGGTLSNSGTIILSSGAFTSSSTTAITNAGVMTGGSGAWDFNGALTNNLGATINAPTSNWFQSARGFANLGTTNIFSGTFTLDGNAGGNFNPGGISFSNFNDYHWDGIVTLQSAFTVLGDANFNIGWGGYQSLQCTTGVYPITIYGNFSHAQGGLYGMTFTFLGNNKTITHTGGDLSAPLVIDGNMNFSQTGASLGGQTVTINSTKSLTLLTGVSGSAVWQNNGTFNLSTGNFDSNGTFTSSSTGAVNQSGGKWYQSAAFLNQGSFVATAGDFIIDDRYYNNFNPGGATFYNFLYSKNDGYATLQSNFDVTNDVTINNTYYSLTGPYTVNVGGNFYVNSGGVTSITFNLTGNNKTYSHTGGSMASTINFKGNISADQTGGSLSSTYTVDSGVVVTLTSDNTIAGVTWVNNGTIITNSYDIVATTLTNNYTFDPGTGTFIFTGTFINNKLIVLSSSLIWDNNGSFTNNAAGVASGSITAWYQSSTFTDSGTFNLTTGTFTVDSAGTISFTAKADGTTSFNDFNVNVIAGSLNLVNNFTVNGNLTFNSTSVANGSGGYVSCPANDCVITSAGNVTVTKAGTSSNDQTWVGNPGPAQNLTIRMTGGTSGSPTTFTLSQTGTNYVDVRMYARLLIEGYTNINYSYSTGSAPAFGVNNANSTFVIANGGTANLVTNLPSSYYSFTNNGTFNIGTISFDNNSIFTNGSTGTVLSSSGSNWYQSSTFTDSGTFNLTAGAFTVDSAGTISFTAKADGTTSFNDFNVNVIAGSLNLVNNFNVNGNLSFNSTAMANGSGGYVSCPANNCVITSAGNVTVTKDGTGSNDQTWVGNPGPAQNLTIRMTGGTSGSPTTFTLSQTGTNYVDVRMYARLELAGYTNINYSYTSNAPAFGVNNANSILTIANGGTANLATNLPSSYYSFTNNGTFNPGANTFDNNGSFINGATGTVQSSGGNWLQSGNFTDNGTFNMAAGVFTVDSGATVTLTTKADGTTSFYNLTISVNIANGAVNFVNSFNVNNDLFFLSTTTSGYSSWVRCPANDCLVTVAGNVLVTNSGSSTNWQTLVGDPSSSQNFTVKMTGGTQANPKTLTVSETGQYGPMVYFYSKLQIAGYVTVSQSYNSSIPAFGLNSANSTMTINNGGTLKVGSAVTSNYYSITNNGTLETGSNNFTNNGALTNNGTVVTGTGTFTNNGAFTNNDTFSLGSGISDINGAFINSVTGIVVPTAGTWNQSGDFTDNGTFTATGGLFVFDTYAYGAKTLTFSPNNTTTFYNLKFNTDVQGWYGYLTIYLVNNFTVSNDLLFNQTSNNPYGYTTSLISTNNTVITVHKNVTVTNNGSSTYTTVGDPAGTSNFTIKMVDGTQASPTVFTYTQTGTTTVRLYAKLEFAGYTNISCSVDNPSYSTFGANVAGSTMAISNGATAVMLTALPSSYYSFTNNGTLYTNGYTPTIPYIFANNGTLKVQGGETLAITNKDIDSGTVEYVGDGGSTSYTNLIYGNTYYSLKINSTSGNNAFTNNANLAIANDLTISNGTFNANALTINILNLVTTGGALNAGSSNIVVSGNWDSSGSIWSCNTSTVVFSAVSGTPAIKTGGQPFYNMNIQKPTGDLVAYWSMNETTGTASVADSSINNNTATSARTTNVTTGIFGNGRSFDGTNDIITVPSQTYYDPGSNDFTIDLWVNFTANNVGYQLILDRRSTVDQTGYILYLESNNTLNFLASSVSSWNILVQSSYVPPTGQWLHISMVRSGNSWNLYVDGVSKASATNSNSVGAVTTNPTIGGGHVAGTMNKVQGTIDEVRYYSRALTLVQIESLRNGIDPFGVSTATYSCQSNLSILNNLNALTATLDVSTNN